VSELEGDNDGASPIAVAERLEIRLGDGEFEQDEEWCEVEVGGRRRRIRFHDYGEIYDIPGLYEKLFYEELECTSPRTLRTLLASCLEDEPMGDDDLRVLDLGAGNGMMGEALKKQGVSRMVGVDIITEARTATERDRPGLYDAYYVEDFCDLNDEKREEIASWSLDCLTTVAALGFGDIPPKAFIEAFNLIQPQGWVALNIKDAFLFKSDQSGFSTMMRELLFSEFLDLHHLERYRHRLSIEGKPLYYFSIAGRKKSDLTQDFLKQFGY
jgi:hypothetical protein